MTMTITMSCLNAMQTPPEHLPPDGVAVSAGTEETGRLEAARPPAHPPLVDLALFC